MLYALTNTHIYNCNQKGSRFSYSTLQIMNNKGDYQTVQMHSLVCAFVVRIKQSGFLAPRPIFIISLVNISHSPKMGTITKIHWR